MRLIPVMIAAALATVSANAAELTGTLQKIKETNRIILGIQEASVPFSYLDGDQKAIGYAVDICMRIVDAAKRELKGIEHCRRDASGHVVQSHSAHDERNRRSRLFFHHQQCGAAASGGVHKFAFPVGYPLCREEIRQHHDD